MAYSCAKQFRILTDHNNIYINNDINGILDTSVSGWRTNKPSVLLKQRSTDRLSGMSSQDEIHGLILQGIEDFLRGFVQIAHEPLQSFFDVGLGGRGILVDKISFLELVASAMSDLDFLGQVGQVEHVREGLGYDNGVTGIQARQDVPEFLELLRVVLSFVLSRKLITLLNLF